jgi:hypothetical protein
MAPALQDGKMKQTPVFETTNVDLAAYLMLEGIKYLECRNDKSMGKDLVILRFLDDKQNCLDLERVFMGSQMKRYRDLTKYLLKEVHGKLRERS